MIPDGCCHMCRSATGVCLTRFTCDHHQEARRQQDAADNHKTISYRDPTGEQAAARVDRQRARRKP